jgi:hypothetical protein
LDSDTNPNAVTQQTWKTMQHDSHKTEQFHKIRL